MRRMLRWALVGVGGVVSLALLGLLVLVLMPAPSRPPSTEVVERTPARVERGRYLFHHVAMCAECHSEHDGSRAGWPIKEGALASGVCFTAWGEQLCAPNLTPHPSAGVGGWTDGELMRAIREGVDRHGEALVDYMQFSSLRHLSDEDVRSIVAYMRTLPPSDRPVRRAPLSFPLSLAVKFLPEPLEGPVPEPRREDRMAYGRYLAEVACGGCHHGMDGTPFAGGQPVLGWNGVEHYSANLTPDPKAGIGGWPRDVFLLRFKSTDAMDAQGPGDESGGAMPWSAFAGMSEEDLGAIYDYLRTVPPVGQRPGPPMVAGDQAG